MNNPMNPFMPQNQFQGAQGFPPQGQVSQYPGFNPAQQQFQQPQQQNQQINRSGFGNHIEVELIGNIAGIKDANGNRVAVVSEPKQNGGKKAVTYVAVNHVSREEADFWKIEIHAKSNDDGFSRLHDNLVDFAEIGRKVFIKGTPVLNRDNEGHYWPTIYVSKIIFLDQKKSNDQQQTQPSPQNQIPQQVGAPAQMNAQNGFNEAPQQSSQPPANPFMAQQVPSSNGFTPPARPF